MFDPLTRLLRLRRARTDDRCTMHARTATIKQLVDDGSYPIDETAIAEAILVRALARRTVPELAFRLAPPKPPVRSFRRHSGARSFRLARAERRPSEPCASAALSPA